MVMFMKNTFSCGKRLRQLRMSCQMSQEELALAAEITTVYISQIEREIRNPTVQVIERLCHAMGLTLADFFCDATNKPEEEHYALQISQFLQNKTSDEKEIYLQILNKIDHLQRNARKKADE